MDLYVLRHAIAVPRDDLQPGEDDAERPLTEPGIEKMRRAARGMKRLDLEFDRILSSPYRRAKETAEIVREVCGGAADLEIFPPLAAETPPEAVIRELANRYGAAGALLLVGHEPQLSALASLLLAGDAAMGLELKKGGLFKLRLDRIRPGGGVLEWWLTPKQLRRIAG